jgi:hypothetical protein
VMVGDNIVAPSLVTPLVCNGAAVSLCCLYVLYFNACVVVVGHRTLGHGFWLG